MDFLLLKNVRNNSCCAHGELLGQPELKLDIIYLAVPHLSCGVQIFHCRTQTFQVWCTGLIAPRHGES